MHFREWKVLYFDQNFIEVCSRGSNWQYSSIGLDNGLAPNRQQAIILTNADPIHWHIYVALGGDELMILNWLILCLTSSWIIWVNYQLYCNPTETSWSPGNQRFRTGTKWPTYCRQHFQIWYMMIFCIDTFVFQLRFECNLFPMVQLTMSQHWFRWSEPMMA